MESTPPRPHDLRQTLVAIATHATALVRHLPGVAAAVRRRILPLTACFLALFSRPARAIDIVRFDLYKGQSFTQTGTNSPILATNLPYTFQAVASPLYLPYVSGVALQTPAGANHPMIETAQMDNGGIITNFVFSDAAASQTALDAAYGAGNYTLTYTGMDDGASSVVLALGADSFPPTPVISNLIAAQTINTVSNFTLAFSSWLPANTNNLEQLIILDIQSNVVFATPDIYSLDPQVLTGTNTSVLIQSGTLTNGQTYTGILAFTELVTNNLYDFTGYPFVLGGFFSQTIFTIQTQSTGPTNTAPAAAAPAAFANSFLTLVVSNGTGPFAAAGTYEIFTAPLGSNYTVLGPAGAGLGSGNYAYAQTGTNTGTLTFTDSHAGTVSLQVTFNQAGAGTFFLSNSGGSQGGAFSATLAYANLNPPLLFLPGLTNGQFQAYLSGNLGVNYSIDASTNLSTWSPLTNLTITTLSTNFYLFDSYSSAHRYYRARASSTAFAPGSLNGLNFNCTVNGASPVSTNGAFQWSAASNAPTYQILAPSGALTGSGSYTYTLTTPNIATISYTETSTGTSYSEQLVFSSAASGYFYVTNTGSSAFESGSFTVSQGPTLFLGNAKFTPDTTRAASVDYLATGTPVTMSVTDAAGYVWTLNIPGDALLSTTPRTITMTPFANLDSSASALPLISGVQLGPEGLQFCDGLTLTLKTPSALGAHATLMMGNGDGSGLYLVQTTNSANSYSTTLFHFSSGAASDPDDQQWQNYVNQNLPQAQAAYSQAQSQVQALERPVVFPPEPPDYEFKCSGNPAADATVAAWQQSLFSQESAAIQNLLSCARSLVLLTGDDSYGNDAISLARQLIETAGYRKIDSLFANYSGNPLKANPVAVAAFGMDRQDELLGGSGRPDWLTDVLNWMQGNVINYYWDKLRNGHDYSMAPVLLSIERQIQLLGGSGEDSFLSQLASAYTFQVNLNVSDIGGPDAYVAQWFTLTAQGMITITQDPQFIGPISGTNDVNYQSGVYGDKQNYFVQLPLSFSEQIVMTMDACTNMTATIYVATMGATNETWNGPDGPEIDENYLSLDFDGAFYSQHGTGDINMYYDCQYYFTVPLQNQQAEAVNQTFTGPGIFAADDTVTFTITVQHTPK